MKQLNIVLLSREEASLAEVASVLASQNGFELTWLPSADQAWDYLSNHRIDVAVVSDELQGCTGLQFVKKLVAVNPFVNCALASPLSPDAFHEATEGYGVFMQLQVPPAARSAYDMIEQLRKIYQLSK